MVLNFGFHHPFVTGECPSLCLDPIITACVSDWWDSRRADPSHQCSAQLGALCFQDYEAALNSGLTCEETPLEGFDISDPHLLTKNHPATTNAPVTDALCFPPLNREVLPGCSTSKATATGFFSSSSDEAHLSSVCFVATHRSSSQGSCLSSIHFLCLPQTF